jgi:hypothetical protein
MTTQPKFRGNSVTAIDITDSAITVWFREVKLIRKPDSDPVAETVRVLDPIELPFSSLSDKVRLAAMQKALANRLIDKAAFPMKDGKTAPVADKWAACKAVADHYRSGTESWDLPAAGRTSLSADTLILIQALQRIYGGTREDTEEYVRDMSADDRNTLRVDPDVKPVIDTIVAENAATAAARGGKSAADLKAGLAAKFPRG